jgi:cell wall assembly regulator SMI1
MDWHELVTEAFQTNQNRSVPAFPRFEPGASEESLSGAEDALGQRLPDDLRTFLGECDGVMEVLKIHDQEISSLWIVWPVEEIVKGRSASGRATLGPPAEWLVFANAGVDGIDFAYDRAEGSGRIWAWHPMESRRQLVGESLAEFLRGWIEGAVTV